jgi:hypothetical protein
MPASFSLLPLLVYIHGGGFVLGQIDEPHNTALLTAQSLPSSPVITASIQYRLGALGYLHVPEPGAANLALHDQRTALRWLQRFAAGFGGDARRVTVFGESAGAKSICAHMLSAPPEEGPLFTRAVLMSGVLTTPVLAEEAQRVYESFWAEVGIEERGRAGLEKLREVSVERIVEASAARSNTGNMWLPVQDAEWFGEATGSVSWDKVPELIGRCEWIEEIVLGTTGFEVCRYRFEYVNHTNPTPQGTPFLTRVADITPRAFLEGIAEQLGDKSAEIVSRAYDVVADMDQSLFITAALRWFGDVIFDGSYTRILMLMLTC